MCRFNRFNFNENFETVIMHVNQHGVLFNNLAIELNKGPGGIGKGRGSAHLDVAQSRLKQEIEQMKVVLDTYHGQITGTFLEVDKKIQEMVMSAQGRKGNGG